MTVETIAQTFGQFISELSYKKLPEAVITEAKYRILDYIASALPAWNEPSVRIIIEWVTKQNSNAESSILRHKKMTASHYAALINGVMGHSLELDDSLPSIVHPGVVVVPPALALAERESVDGRNLLTSIVIGYEIACRVGAAAAPIGILHKKGFHPTGVNGVFGSTAASCKVLGLDSEKIAKALGIAGSMSSGLLECTRDGTWTKRLHPGWAAHNGVIAAELAKMGFTAPRSIFEGGLGYLHAFAGNTSDPSKMLEGLGETFWIFRPGYKLYACCKASHAPINAVLRILEKHPEINYRNVESIMIRMQEVPYLLVAEPRERKYRPQTTVDAQFSIYYSIAVTLVDKKPPLHDAFSIERLQDERVLDLAKRVLVTVDNELEKNYGKKSTMDAVVTVKMKDGSSFTGKNSDDFDHPPYDQIEGKFMRCATSVLAEGRAKELLAKVKQLEKLTDISELFEIINS